MSQITSRDDIQKLGTIMGIWAHPDDETFTAGGIMATAKENGQTVICVTATRGERGVQDESRWPANKLGQIREGELRQALQTLGVTNLHILDQKDGLCSAKDQDAIRIIQDLINSYKPDTILTFGRDGLTGHPDHMAVCEWVLSAAALANKMPQVYHAVVTAEQYDKGMDTIDAKLNYFYNIDKLNLATPKDCAICFGLPTDIVKKKYQALSAMPSQYAPLITQFSEEQVCNAFSIEAFVQA